MSQIMFLQTLAKPANIAIVIKQKPNRSTIFFML